jgi:hypothetical protein
VAFLLNQHQYFLNQMSDIFTNFLRLGVLRTVSVPEIASLFEPASLSLPFVLHPLKNVSITARVASSKKFSVHLNMITFSAFNRLTKAALYAGI